MNIQQLCNEDGWEIEVKKRLFPYRRLQWFWSILLIIVIVAAIIETLNIKENETLESTPIRWIVYGVIVIAIIYTTLHSLNLFPSPKAFISPLYYNYLRISTEMVQDLKIKIDENIAAKLEKLIQEEFRPLETGSKNKSEAKATLSEVSKKISEILKSHNLCE